MNGRKDTAGKQNKGFSLITVIIAVSFIGILGLLVLYMALSNFQMKIIDLKGKDSFYTAERAIEEIRVGLQEDVGNCTLGIPNLISVSITDAYPLGST